MNFKKLLSAVGLLAVAAPVSLSVVACGPTQIEKTNLSTLELIKEIDGNTANLEAQVLNTFIELNSKIEFTDKDLKIENFKAATAETPGSAKISATPESKYSGSVEIVITVISEERELSDAISNGNYKYIYVNAIGVDTIFDDVNMEKFIADGASPIKINFSDFEFISISIDVDGKQEVLTDTNIPQLNDGEDSKDFESQINFNYGSIKDQTAKLTITISNTENFDNN